MLRGRGLRAATNGKTGLPILVIPSEVGCHADL